MNKTPLLLSIAAVLALNLPVHARRAAGPEPEEPGPAVPDRQAGDRPGFAPEENALEKKQREIVKATPLSVEAKDGLQPFKDGFITRDGKSILFRRADERATVLFTLDKEATAFWALGDGSGVVYAADGKLRYKPAEGAESELGAAPDGAPAISAGTSRIAWNAGGHLWVANTGRTAAIEVSLPEKRALGSFALSPDGMNLFASFSETGGEAKTWEIMGMAPFTETKQGWMSRSNRLDAEPANLALLNDGTVVYTQPRVSGGRTLEAVQVLRAGEVEPATIAVADGVTDLVFASGERAAAFSAKGANGRRKIWRIEFNPVHRRQECQVESIAEIENADCVGLTRACSTGSAWFVKKTEGAADRVCRLEGF